MALETALAALAEQHFGEGLNAAHLFAILGSTANALESLPSTNSPSCKNRLLIQISMVKQSALFLSSFSPD